MDRRAPRTAAGTMPPGPRVLVAGAPRPSRVVCEPGQRVLVAGVGAYAVVAPPAPHALRGSSLRVVFEPGPSRWAAAATLRDCAAAAALVAAAEHSSALAAEGRVRARHRARRAARVAAAEHSSALAAEGGVRARHQAHRSLEVPRSFVIPVAQDVPLPAFALQQPVWAQCPASGGWAPATIMALSEQPFMKGEAGLAHAVAWERRCRRGCPSCAEETCVSVWCLQPRAGGKKPRLEPGRDAAAEARDAAHAGFRRACQEVISKRPRSILVREDTAPPRGDSPPAYCPAPPASPRQLSGMKKPLQKSTSKLLHTYQSINERRCGQRSTFTSTPPRDAPRPWTAPHRAPDDHAQGPDAGRAGAAAGSDGRARAAGASAPPSPPAADEVEVLEALCTAPPVHYVD